MTPTWCGWPGILELDLTALAVSHPQEAGDSAGGIDELKTVRCVKCCDGAVARRTLERKTDRLRLGITFVCFKHTSVLYNI